METGEIIKILRKQKGITQTELGEVLGVNTSSIQKYESGAVNNLKMGTIKTLCEYFKVPPWIIVFQNYVPNEEVVLDIASLGDRNLEYPLTLLYKLNADGRRKAMTYVKDLIDSGNYK